MYDNFNMLNFMLNSVQIILSFLLTYVSYFKSHIFFLLTFVKLV